MAVRAAKKRARRSELGTLSSWTALEAVRCVERGLGRTGTKADATEKQLSKRSSLMVVQSFILIRLRVILGRLSWSSKNAIIGACRACSEKGVPISFSVTVNDDVERFRSIPAVPTSHEDQRSSLFVSIQRIRPWSCTTRTAVTVIVIEIIVSWRDGSWPPSAIVFWRALCFSVSVHLIPRIDRCEVSQRLALCPQQHRAYDNSFQSQCIIL